MCALEHVLYDSIHNPGLKDHRLLGFMNVNHSASANEVSVLGKSKHCRRYERNAHMKISDISVNQFYDSGIFPTNYGPIKRVGVWKKTKDIMRKISLGKVIFTHLMERCLSPHIKPFKGATCFKVNISGAFKCILWRWVTLRMAAKL